MRKVTGEFPKHLDREDVLAAIRAPEDHPRTKRHVNLRPKEVVEGLQQLMSMGEEDAVVSFIAADPTRFEIMAERGQFEKLMQVVELLGKADQTKLLSAVESEMSGVPDAGVLKKIAHEAKKPEMEKRFNRVMLGLDTQQQTTVLSAPNAAWWLGAFDHLPLLYTMADNLSQPQRQQVVNKTDRPQQMGISMTLRECCSPQLTDLFKNCKFPKAKAGAANAR